MALPFAFTPRLAFHIPPPVVGSVPPPVIGSVPPPVIGSVPPPVIPVVRPVLNVPITENTISSTTENEREIKLSEFLKQFTNTKKEKIDLTIPEFRALLKTAFIMSDELVRRKRKLYAILDHSDDIWNSEMKEIAGLKGQLSEICNLVISIMNSGCISKKLRNIKKRREQKKKTKLNAFSEKMKATKDREKLNQEIDKWLDDLKEKNLKLKREAEMKKEADYILLEVRRKIHEAKRTIEKIKTFEKLRNVRQDNAVKKGLHILPEHNENFQKKMTILKEIMSKQLADYEAEEKALKVMLETEQEGQLEEEAEWKLRKAKALQQKKQKHIYECLFGSTDDPSPSDPLYFFHKFHTSANQSIENLVQTRNRWDVYLDKDGESIPQQWVVPVSDCDTSWKKYLVK